MAATQVQEYLTPMNVSIRSDQRAWLNQESKATRIPISELVRNALDRLREERESTARP